MIASHADMRDCDAAKLEHVLTVMEAPHLDRKLIAILAAHIEGYSRLMSMDEAGTLATLSAPRDIVDRVIAHHGGRICNTAGDSVLAEFGSVFEAVECA